MFIWRKGLAASKISKIPTDGLTELCFTGSKRYFCDKSIDKLSYNFFFLISFIWQCWILVAACELLSEACGILVL